MGKCTSRHLFRYGGLMCGAVRIYCLFGATMANNDTANKEVPGQIRRGKKRKHPDDPVREVFKAVRSGNADLLSELLQHTDASERTSALETKTIHLKKDQVFWDLGVKCTPLIVAAGNGNLDCVKVLLRYKADMESRCGDDDDDNASFSHQGYTPLLMAARNGHFDVVSCLVENGADVNSPENNNLTPLMMACKSGHVNVVTFLVEHGARVHLQDKVGKTALHYAIKGHNNREIMRCLIENGADVNAGADGSCLSTPLMLAIASTGCSVDAVTFLLEHGAIADVQNKDGETALHNTVKYNFLGKAHVLLTHGASQSVYDSKQLTPLLSASNLGKTSMVECFINRPECTKEQRIDALELLGASFATSHFHYINPDPGRAFEYIKCGMEERFQDRSHPVLKQPMEPVEAYQNKKECQTLEELAQIEGDVDAIIMESLIIRERILGSDNTVLTDHIRKAVRRYSFCWHFRNFDTCISLLRHAMKIDQHSNHSFLCDIEMLVPVLYNMIKSNFPLRQKLVLEVFQETVLQYEKQMDEFQRKKSELNHLMHCIIRLLQIFAKVELCEEEKNSSIPMVLQKLANLNLQNGDGSSLLHMAAAVDTHLYRELLGQPYMSSYLIQPLFEFPCAETVKLLLKMGINVNAVNNDGDTPLHKAVTFKPNNDNIHLLTDTLEVLLDGGAHHDFVNNDSKTAMDVAQTDEACWILNERKTLSQDLKCIAAKAVKKFGLPYVGVVPKTLEKFTSMH